LRGQRRFAGAGRAHDQRAGAAIDAAAEHLVERRHTARHRILIDEAAMFRRNETRINDDATGLDVEVVIAVAEIQPADLHELQPAPRVSIHRRVALQLHHAMGDALQLQVVHLGRPIVEEQYRDVPIGEELFQRQDLLAIAQCALGQQANLGKRVEDDAFRLEAIDFRQHRLDRLSELDLRWIEDRGVFFFERLLTDELFEDVYVGHVPVVGLRHVLQLGARFGEREIQPDFAVSRAFQQELQPERGLADAGIALQQVDVVARKSA
jgi:hypothetical protein